MSDKLANQDIDPNYLFTHKQIAFNYHFQPNIDI